MVRKSRKAKANKDEFAVGVGSAGVQVRSVGLAADRLANQLADLLSPFTEGAGYFGDRIRLVRQKVAIETLQDAHKVAQERGFQLGPVPPKFLVEWLENASVQDEDETELKKLWSKLLASASQDYEPSYIAYLDLLKKIGPRDAELLQFLAQDTSPQFSKNFYQLPNWRKFPNSMPEIVAKKTEQISLAELLELAEGVALQANCILLYISTPDTLVLPTKHFIENERSCAVLEREGAVKIQVRKVEIWNQDIDFAWLEITKFGFDFVWACEGVLVGVQKDTESIKGK